MLPSDQIFTFLLGGLAAGMVVGSVPLVLALKRKRESLGYTLFAFCIIASLALGLLAGIPVAAIGVIILLSTKRKADNEPK